MHQYKNPLFGYVGSELWLHNLVWQNLNSDRYVAQLKLPSHQCSAYTTHIHIYLHAHVYLCVCACVCQDMGYFLRAGYVNDGHGIAWVQLIYLWKQGVEVVC